MDSAHRFGRLLSATAAILFSAVASAALIGPAPAAAVTPLPDLQITVTVTPVQATYAVGDTVTTTATIKNVGGATAANAHIDVLRSRFSGLDLKPDSSSAVQNLEPGQSFSIVRTYTINQTAAENGLARGTYTADSAGGEATPANNAVVYSFIVPAAPGVLKGKVYVDAKNTTDATQPGLAGATVVARKAADHRIAGTVQTSADGSFTLPLPAGQYYLVVTGRQLGGPQDTGRVIVKNTKTIEINLPLVPTTPGTSSTTPVPATSAPAGSGGGEPSLPITGSSTGAVILTGAAALLFGTVIVFAVRRRRNRFVLPG